MDLLADNEDKVAIICETELLGERVQQRERNKRRVANPDTLIRNLAELKIGQPVVHLEHGVGRYGGLVSLENGGIRAEFYYWNMRIIQNFMYPLPLCI